MLKKKDKDLMAYLLFFFCFVSLVFWGMGHFRFSRYIFTSSSWFMIAMVAGLTAVLLKKGKAK